MPKRVIYVAGPYRAPSLMLRLWNILRAWTEAYGIWKAGHVALCPHLNTLLMCEDTRQTGGQAQADFEAHILAGDLLLLERCSAVFVLPGSDKSVGTQGEIRHAEAMCIPVLTSHAELAKFLSEAEINV